MAKQSINLGTAPTGVGGDTPRSAFTKANANFDELYAFDATLKTAAKVDTGLSVGNVQLIGSPPPINGHAAFAQPGSHFINYGDDTISRPAGGSYWSGFRAQYPFLNCGMDLVAEVVTGTGLNLRFRTINQDGSPWPWRIIYHDGNTTRAADGTLKAI